VGMVFGPTQPKDKNANWIKTVPGYPIASFANLQYYLDEVFRVRRGEPAEAVHFAASLLAGKNLYQAGNFFLSVEDSTTVDRFGDTMSR